MKTTIETKTAGTIEINSVFKGDKEWKINSEYSKTQSNFNNHRVTVKHKGKQYSFDFWGSIAEPTIRTDQGNVFALYCSLSDAASGNEAFENFCGDFGYDPDSRTAERVYKACKRTLDKVERVFSCDLYELLNEIQEDWNC